MAMAARLTYEGKLSSWRLSAWGAAIEIVPCIYQLASPPANLKKRLLYSYISNSPTRGFYVNFGGAIILWGWLGYPRPAVAIQQTLCTSSPSALIWHW